MAKRKEKKPGTENEKSAFHGDLEGFDIKVNAFGEMESTIDMDKLNDFLNRKVKDKKLGQPDAPDNAEQGDSQGPAGLTGITGTESGEA